MISAKCSFGKGIKIVLCSNMFVINSFTSLPFDIFAIEQTKRPKNVMKERANFK